jgi:hypothetical protein
MFVGKRRKKSKIDNQFYQLRMKGDGGMGLNPTCDEGG